MKTMRIEGIERIKSIKITVPSSTPGYMRTFGKTSAYAAYLASGIIRRRGEP